MRRLTLWAVSTVSALVLLLSYRTSTMGTGGVARAAAPAIPPTSSSGPGTTGGTTSATGSGAAGTSSSSSSSSRTVTGDSVATRWGPVRVRITVAGGRVTDATAVVYPQGNRRDLEINTEALPVLHDEVISAQSAQVDTISGATATSDGYISSLQSALDAAHLGS